MIKLDIFRQILPRSLATTALMAGSVAFSASTAGTQDPTMIALNAVIALVTSLAGGVTANDIYKTVAEQINHDDVLANHDLTKALVDAILVTIHQFSREPQNYSISAELSRLDNSKALLELFEGEINAAVLLSAKSEFERIGGDEIVEIFRSADGNFSTHGAAISPDAWEEVIIWLAVKTNANLPLNYEYSEIAKYLHIHFTKNFFEVIKVDFEKGGKAYAALQLKINNRLLAGQDEIFSAISVVSQQVENIKQLLLALQKTFPAEIADMVVDRLRLLAGNNVFGDDSGNKALKLKSGLREALNKTLYKEPANPFFQKHVPNDIYRKRKGEDVFGNFIEQNAERCFTVIAKAGMGKTCFLCRMAESLAAYHDNILPLLISAENLRLTTKNRSELEKAILDQVTSAAPGSFDGENFESFGEFLKANGLKLVVLLDGINELPGYDSRLTFNSQFGDLLDIISGKDLPVLFALTCRFESWQYFTLSSWATKHVYRRSLTEQATILIEAFTEKEVDQLSQDYFKYFAIKGTVTGEARKTCGNPLNLRFLCDAYTNRKNTDKKSSGTSIESKRVDDLSSLKRLEILRQYVASRRSDFRKIFQMADIEATPSSIYRLTTLYIIHIANFMYKHRRASISSREVVELAAGLGHPDAALGAAAIITNQSSVFMNLIDLGVFSRSGPVGDEKFAFVYETYFEFSLGRYFAFVRWPELAGKHIDEKAVRDDLEQLIDEHPELNKNADFSNLFGAIQFAVLATETGDWIYAAESLPPDEKIYEKHPYVFSSLIRCLAETKKGFDWLQQACAIIRESELVEEKTWRTIPDEKRDDAVAQFGKLLQALDNLATTTDFVLLWDIENTLQTLALINFDQTLNHVREWAESGEKLKAVFASQVVSRLALIDGERVLDVLLEWIKDERLYSDFWIARSILFAISEIGRLHESKSLSRSSQWSRIRDQVHHLIKKGLDGEVSPYTTSRALAILPQMSALDSTELNKIDRYIDALLNDDQAWQLLNFVFSLADLAENPHLQQWIANTLEKIAGHTNHNVLYMVERALDVLKLQDPRDDETREKVSCINEAVKKARWRTNRNYNRRAPGTTDKIGIVYSPKYLEPDYENHIECRERLIAILSKLESTGEVNFNWLYPSEAEEQDLKKAHTQEFDFHRNGERWDKYVETIREISKLREKNKDWVERSGASELRFESFDIAKLAAGGVIEGINYVTDTDSPAAFVLNRPPGHLANNTICIFNNIAVGAQYALDNHNLQIERILIVDCDAHHGKHTQQVFYRSDKVVYFSMHIDGDYAKESGRLDNDGEGPGKGYTFNIPYPPNMNDDGYRYIIDKLLVPFAKDFKPDLILISGGFDGHFDDPLTPVCLLSEASYIHLAQRLKEVAIKNKCKIVGALEGGYGLDGMARSLVQMLNVWGDWNLEDKIGFVEKPHEYEKSLNPDSLEHIKDIVRKRVEMMLEAKKADNSYFFEPSARYWKLSKNGNPSKSVR